MNGVPKFEAYITSYVITSVYLNGKWQFMKQIMKCTGAKTFQLSRIDFQVRHNISIEEEMLNNLVLMHSLAPPGGNGPQLIQRDIKHGGAIIDSAMPYNASIDWPGLSAIAYFKMTPEISANISNVKDGCLTPGDGLTVEEVYETVKEEDKPQPKPGMSITESIKAKMPLYAEGYECVSLRYLENGAGCEDNTIEIRNNCKNVMAVQVALKNKQGTYKSRATETMRPNTSKTINIGCESNQAKFVSVRERERPNLCSDQEWFLISVMDKSSGSKLDLPFKYTKPKPEPQYVPGSLPNIAFKQEKQNQNGSQTVGGFEQYANEKTPQYKGSGADEFQKSGAAFKITDRLFSCTYTAPGNKTIHVLYRFSNDSWSKGKTWFQTYVWIKDPDQYNHDRDYWAYGWWTLQNGRLEITQYNGWNKVESKPDKSIVEGLTFRMKEYHVGDKGSIFDPIKADHLYKVHSLNDAPAWVPIEVKDIMLNRFTPRN